MNEDGEYFVTDQTASSHQFPILLDDKGGSGLLRSAIFFSEWKSLKNCNALGG
jgi:hypothetical protein